MLITPVEMKRIRELAGQALYLARCYEQGGIDTQEYVGRLNELRQRHSLPPLGFVAAAKVFNQTLRRPRK